MKSAIKNYHGQRGAALVLVLLIMLVLSGLGLVAMKATLDSSTLSGMHRLQLQAKSFSNAINQLGVMRSGRSASTYHAQLQNLAGQPLAADDVQGVSDAELDMLRRRGGFMIFSSDPNTSNPAENTIGAGSGSVGSFLDGGDFVDSVEAENPVSYAYIVRDMVAGPRVEGFGDEFCFVVVDIGSQSNIGGVSLDDGMDAEERMRQPQALGRNVKRTMIGPVECGGG